MKAVSPSSLKTYSKCPKQFGAKYVSKEIPWSDYQSPEAARGDSLHKLLEQLVNSGWNESVWPEFGNAGFVKEWVTRIHNLKQQGWILKTEQKLAIDAGGKLVPWFAKDAFARSQIDVIGYHPEVSYGMIVDWKTGKRRKDDENIQLALNAICAASVVHPRTYKAFYLYIDAFEAAEFVINVDIPTPEHFRRDQNLDSQLYDMYCVVDDLKQSWSQNFWPEKGSYLCRWCDHPNCEEKAKWVSA